MENIPFSDTIFTRSGTTIDRPLLLIESPSRFTGDDKSKHRTTPRSNDGQGNKTTAASEQKSTQVAEGTSQNNLDKQQNKKANSGDVRPKRSKLDTSPVASSNSSAKLQLDGSEKLPITESPSEAVDVVGPPTVKNESEKSTSTSPSVARPVFEDNIVLGVAFEGSKRTLPIEEGIGMGSAPKEAGDVAAGRSGNGSSSNVKDRKGQMPAVPGAGAKDHRDQER